MADNPIFDNGKPQEKIFNLLFEEDDLTWQNIIYDLVRREGMDPWDIDVSEIAHKFLEMLKKLREMDFRISGKVVLASAILLKIKSNRLVEEDITALDSLMSSVDEPENLLDELTAEETGGRVRWNNPKLMPKTPQPRKRKVSVYDLVKALEKALEVEVRRPPKYVPPKVSFRAPDKIDVGEMINDTYQRVLAHYNGPAGQQKQILTFTQLIPSDSKEDKVYTFIPLLHLENQRRVDMAQKVHFGEIEIDLARLKPVESAVKAPENPESNDAKTGGIKAETKVDERAKQVVPGAIEKKQKKARKQKTSEPRGQEKEKDQAQKASSNDNQPSDAAKRG
jgi:segregation and condensation protein A